jgi:hypothetical protein
MNLITNDAYLHVFIDKKTREILGTQIWSVPVYEEKSIDYDKYEAYVVYHCRGNSYSKAKEELIRIVSQDKDYKHYLDMIVERR